MKNKIKLLAIIGKAGCGKDFILHRLTKQCSNIHEVISCTTRSPRMGEENGKSYHFLTKKEFAIKIANDLMLEYTFFNNNFYGTAFADLDENKVNIGVFNPEGYKALVKNNDIDLLTLNLLVDDKVRIIRQIERDDNVDIDELIRRFKADNRDFRNFYLHGQSDFVFNNNTEEDAKIILDSIIPILSSWSS